MQLAFQQYGSGPPLFILHGLFGSSDNWHSIGKALGEWFHVFAIDLRNHGRSPHSEEMNYELMAADLSELISRRLPEPSSARIHLLGHSMGGKVAMQFAINFSANLEKLIIVDIAPKAYPPWHSEIFKGLQSLALGELTTRADADARLATTVQDVAVRAFLLKNLARNSDGRFFWKFNLPDLARHYAELNSNLPASGLFDGPALFLAGANSDYLAASDLPEIQKRFPAAILKVIPGAGHWVHAEQPQAFLQIVTEFLSGNSAS